MPKQINHTERAHALLSPSSAHRWLNCNTSARATEHIKDSSSSFAQEGTLAHELSELKVREWQGLLTKADAKKEHKRIESNPMYNSDMEDYTESYLEYIQEKFNTELVNTPDAVLAVEEKIDFSDYVRDGKGSCDCNIISDEKLIVIDFKYGQGVSVKAEKNPQAMLYALGALLNYEMLYGIKEVELCIYQPRTNNFSEWTTTPEEIKTWAEYYVKPRAELAYKGEGQTISGDWCKFCKIAGTCRARADQMLEESSKLFELGTELTNDELGDVLLKFEGIESWMKAAKEAAYVKAMNGEEIKGHKIVEGRSRRKYTDEKAIIDKLLDAGYERENITTTELLAITKLEKEIGKKQVTSLIGDFIEKPQGTPTLVVLEDKRPAIIVGVEHFNDLIE